jgi:hypothetical protein
MPQFASFYSFGSSISAKNKTFSASFETAAKLAVSIEGMGAKLGVGM